MADEPKLFPPSPEFQKNAYYSSMEQYEAEYAAPEEGADEDEESENLLPSQYADPSTSGLKATVTTNPADNVFDFELEG